MVQKGPDLTSPPPFAPWPSPSHSTHGIHTGTMPMAAPHRPRTTQSPRERIPTSDTRLSGYRHRIAELRHHAGVEGIAINAESESDFWALLNSGAPLRPADLVLLDTGNLRAIWDDDRGRHIRLQFRGHVEIQYVMFACNNDDRRVRTAGRDTWEGVAGAVEEFGVASILHER